MTIIEVPQGYYGNLEGVLRNDAVEMFQEVDEAFLKKFPQCRVYYRKSWHEFVVLTPETMRAPWGHEWYLVDDAGILHMHSAQYDTSG